MKSVVSDHPGTTRNAKHGQFFIKGKRISLIDTGGIDSLVYPFANRIQKTNGSHSLSRIEDDAVRAIKMSDMVLLVLDGQEGLTPLDTKIARKLRLWSKDTPRGFKINLVVNKLDREGSKDYYEALSTCLSDCYSLEMGEPVFVSAVERTGIKSLLDLISEALNIRDANRNLNLEDMALMANHHIDNERSAYNGVGDMSMTDADIDRSMRVFSPVSSSFKPHERWMRLLNSVCDNVPFTIADEGDFVVPPVLSPGEKIAQMYISKSANNRMFVDQSEGDTTVENSYNDIESTQPKIEETSSTMLPLRVVLLGSVASCQDTLARLLADSKINSTNVPEFIGDTLSPNWHQYYVEWGRDNCKLPITQPVELYSAAALNLGGSLGRVASMQTLALVRKADIIIMCVQNTDERHAWKVHLTKKECAWVSRIIRSHKPMVLVVPAQQPPKRKMELDLSSTGHEFDGIPILSLPMINAGLDNTTELTTPDVQHTALRRLRNEVLALARRSRQVIETSVLNNWLRKFLAKWPPPWHDGAKVNVKFAAQVRGNPPTFIMWSNVYGVFPQHYMRQIKRAISDEFGFKGVPLKFILRTTAEPKSTGRRHNLSWKRKLHSD
ncbi:GTPase, putative [Babesia bigemina]|uniref:GTPase, putative n=1 Tax=Babesia bigemina TaxID=5866 RepID=A0A061DEM5_BABBI|nr:GTPase, putative [Babesia bigemina]CDR97540.1 GTPase, putative [Babesia bigemina]|eukprot:XP_012769726.1 GTPase, putative [Babesia bigemina]